MVFMTDEKLIGQLRLSRGSGRNRRMSDHALNEARRDGWVATRGLIEQLRWCAEKGGYLRSGQSEIVRLTGNTEDFF